MRIFWLQKRTKILLLVRKENKNIVAVKHMALGCRTRQIKTGILFFFQSKTDDSKKMENIKRPNIKQCQA